MLRLLGARHVAACEFNQTNGNGHGVYTEVQYAVSGPLDASQDLPWDFSQDPALQSREEFLTPVKSPELKAKYFVIVRHGHSTWNDQGRIQGNTDESELTETGRIQAFKARDALEGMHFDSCFASPHKRARQTAEILWEERGQQLGAPLYLDTLREANLGWFQGLKNEDIARLHPELFRVWRQEPEHFCLDGRYPVLDAFRQARQAWKDMLAAPGTTHLVVTHKSLLRSMLCAAMGLPPRQFRAIDISNAAVCMVRCNEKGDMMLSALNLTTHLEYDNIKYKLPIKDKNDTLAETAAVQNNAINGLSDS